MLGAIATAIYRPIAWLASGISSLFWTVFYLFYFLVKGKPEWKCDSVRDEPTKNCCVEGTPAPEDFRHHHHHQNGLSSNGIADPTKPHLPRAYPATGFFGRLWQNVKYYGNCACWYVKRAAKWTWKQLCVVFRFFARIWRYIASFFRSIFGSAPPSKTLPSTPKPFSPQASLDSPSYNKVKFDEFKDMWTDEKPPLSVPSSPKAAPMVSARLIEAVKESDAAEAAAAEGSFYAQKVYSAPEEPIRDQREPSMPPPPPPPPPSKPVRIGTSMERERETKTPVPAERKEVNGGIPKLPADLMAELAGSQKMRERAVSAQREMTQSCHPDMPEWKQNMEQDRYDRSATATPWRASSVGPTMRKLEQVVSRLEDSSDNEAQFVFRPKVSDDSAYRMGRSVFTPVDEAEQMREHINRRSTYDSSRPVTPACSLKSYGGEQSYAAPESYIQNNASYSNYQQPSDYEHVRRRARTVGPYSHQEYQPVAPFTQSSAYSNAPFTSHTARRSRTPTAAYDRGNNFAYDRDGVTQGAVTSSVRQWPPVSNATGAPVEKDHFFDMIPNDEGLITTMCKRVVERKTEDNWKWRDDGGRLLDEKNQLSWKGELDTVLRDGPGQGRHWSRTVEMMPTGDTRFQDVSRQYNNNYVVESVIRNY